MNILITGIHGFVGSNLVASLKIHHTIYGLDIVSPHKDGVNKTFSWDELKDIPPVDCIIHLAGKAHDTKNSMTPGMQKRSELHDVGGINPERNDSGHKNTLRPIQTRRRAIHHLLNPYPERSVVLSAVEASKGQP